MLVVAFHPLSLNQQTVWQLPRKVSFPGHGTSSTLKSTQLPPNLTQSATWAPILLFFIWNKWCWHGGPSEEPSHSDCPTLLWKLLVPLAFRSAGPISSPPATVWKAGTGLGTLRAGGFVVPCYKGSYDLKSPFQIALMVLVSTGNLNDCPEQGIVLIYFWVTVFWFNGGCWVYICFHQSDCIFLYIKRMQSCG